MPVFAVETPQRTYHALVERGLLDRVHEFIPASAGKLFLVTTQDVWKLYGNQVSQSLRQRDHHVLFFPGGEGRKRMSEVEALAEQMIQLGGDRSSMVIAMGGGIVNDLGGFLAAIFMRGIPVLQIPTTLLSQVDAAVGGKTGANLISGKNLIGAFHQPLAVLVDPQVLASLPDREYRAGLYEIVKSGVIRSPELFRVMAEQSDKVLQHDAETVDYIISESVRIKAEVVTADEREGDLRRILNFGHTIGHALEADTGYTHYLHGEAVAFGMKAATHLAHLLGVLSAGNTQYVLKTVDLYGPIPELPVSVTPENLLRRTASDKKTIKGSVHYVLPDSIGTVQIRSGIPDETVLEAIRATIHS